MRGRRKCVALAGAVDQTILAGWANRFWLAFRGGNDRRLAGVAHGFGRHFFESEMLEQRVLLNGLTIITHGYELTGGMPGWLTSMGNQIAARMGPDTSIYKMTLTHNSSNDPVVSGFSLQKGPSPTSANSPNADTVLLIDWSADSGIGLPTPYFSTAELASLITPWLTSPLTSHGITAPLAEGPIQLIGHSRGASLVSEIAKDLGKSGIWVDQLTTLDPVPVDSDPAVKLGTNVIFADNYYQTKDITADGSAVSGAVNYGPLSLSGGYASGFLGGLDLAGNYHNNVHLYYFGTVDTAASASDGSDKVPTSWYSANHVTRGLTGYDFSLVGGGVRPLSGVSKLFGGNGSRAAVTTTGTQWPNIGMVTASTTIVPPGLQFSANYDFEYAPSTSNVQFFLDDDQNPYNDNSIAIGADTSLPATGSAVVSNQATLTAPTGTGNYYLEAEITNGSQNRFAYAPMQITVGTITPTQLVFAQQPVSTVAGHSIAPSVSVEIEDAEGRVDITNDSDVTLALSGVTNGATLNGTLTVAAINGVATFDGISLAEAGTYMLAVSDGALAGAVSKSFSVTPDISTSQLVLMSPTGGAVTLGQPLSSITFDVEDQFGNLITSDHSAVTIRVGAGPAGGALTGSTTVKAKGGVAAFKNLGLSRAGSYTLAAADGSVVIATPVQFSQTVAPAATTVAAPHTASSYAFGQMISLSTTFKSSAPSSVPFTGVATLIDNSSDVLGTVTLAIGGQAKFVLTGILPGTYGAVISYPGDANHTAATSSIFTLEVNPAATSVSLSAPSAALVFGQSITLTAAVKSSSAPATPRTGSVTFFDNLLPVGTITLDGNSMASLTLAPAAGKNSFTAVYSGDTDFKTGTSPGLVRTINKDKSSIALTPSLVGAIVHNQTFNLSVHVALIAPGGGTLTGGLVTIKDNGKVLTTLNLDSDGDALLPGLTFSAPGTQSLTAIFAGNGDVLSATSSILKLTIT